MTTNEAGVTLIKSFEGCKLVAYKDVVGVWTIGWGTTGADVHEGMEINQAAADAFLVQDLKRFEEGVFELVHVPLTSNAFSALVCFAYNCGLGNLKSSTLLKKVNAGDLLGAAGEFVKWCHAGGATVPGLLRRRTAEAKLFSS
jgi:lysozyme